MARKLEDRTTKWDRKEYDKLRARKLYLEFRQQRNDLIKNVFGGKCYLCQAESEPDFHLHHIIYDKKSNYPRNANSQWARNKRLEEAQKEPHKFRLLCPLCHIQFSSFCRCLKRFKNYSIEKIFELIPKENNPQSLKS